MVRNKHIQVVNANGTSVVLSGAIIVEYLKDYTSDWGSISTTATIAEIEDDFSPSALEDPTNKANLDTFNGKIGFVLPKISLDSLINEVIVILREEDTKYLTIFQSFNNLEKVAMHFILMIQSNRTVKEIFEMISANYKDLSKRDIMIRLLSEVDIIESEVDVVDPVNGFYKLLSAIIPHNPETSPSFEFGGGNIEFKEFSFPMHSYNVTKAFSGFGDLNSSNDSVRNYYERFRDTWKANYNSAVSSGWFNNNSPLYKSTYWKTILKDSVANEISGSSANRYQTIGNYKGILDQLSHKNIYFDSTEEKPLFKLLGENFFDFNPNSNTRDDEASRAPLTMTKYMSSASATNRYFDRTNLTTGLISYNSTNFKNLKTVLSYYTSDLNIWFTSDNSNLNGEYTDYLHTQDATGFLTSNSKSETKGYFSNIMFIQSAIQRILYPRILKAAQNGFGKNYNLSDVFNIDENVYDTIFDSIVNNSFVYTNKNSSSTDFEDNYEIIPNRAILAVSNPSSNLVNYKATNLYEFIINSLVHSKSDIISDYNRKMVNSSIISSYTRQDLLYKQSAINYNPLDNKMVSDATTLTVTDFDTDNIVYNFGSNYNPTTNNWFDKIVSNFFRMDGSTEKYSKINYRTIKFFKLPVHSATSTIRNNLNRNIRRTNRELLTDISDIANYDIKGLSLADFTYGEKALLKEYIENFRSIKKMESELNYSDADIIEEMIKDLDDLRAWKTSPSNVAITNPNNTYYKISTLANPAPNFDSNTDYYRWDAEMTALKKTVYFPELLSYSNITDIKDFLNRAILKIDRNRTSAKDINFVEQAKEFIKSSAINISWSNSTQYSNDNKLILNSIGANFLKTLKLVISYIKETSEYITEFDLFTTAYQSGVWNDITLRINAIRDVLLNDTLIENAISSNSLYTGYQSGMLKDMDLGLYKVFINNYFIYLVNPNAVAQSDLKKVVLIDNEKTGFIKYYSDVLMLLKFTAKYHELVPSYIQHLNTDILDKYYTRIKSIKSLPSWDYESFHRRDLESDLKDSGGKNSHDYNITWGNSSSNIIMIYRRNGAFSHSYRVSGNLYKGDLSWPHNNNLFRDRWWKRWLTDGSNTYSYTNIDAFKIPYVDITDNNVPFPSTWKYDNPDTVDKVTLFTKMKYNVETYQSGTVANISSFKYVTSNNNTYTNIGVPLLVLGDDGSEWNKPNTVRTDSFSFETDFLNLWYTDEGYDDGLAHNDGGGEAYTWAYQLVSGADKFKKFGLGKMDIQEMFRHFWNMESSPMGNPYNVMAYFVFDTWDEGYDYTVGNFPYATVIDYGSKWSSNDTRKKSNKYDFKFVLQNSYLEGIWSPIRLSGEDRSIGVDPDITSTQISNNFYLPHTNIFRTNTALKNAIFDLYNRNFRNRVYLSYLRWRYYYNQGAW